MKYMDLGNTGIKASVVAFGTWGLGGGSVWDDEGVRAKASDLLDAASDCGLNYIDTAPVYGMGESERLLGAALKGRRGKFIVQTKCSLNWRENGGKFKYARDGFTVWNNTGAEAMRKDVEGSLSRLGTDFIDVLVIHYPNGAWPVEETADALEELVKEGKIRAWGLSNSTPAILDEYSKHAHVALVQEQYSLLAPSHGEEFFPSCRRHKTSFQCYGILEEGYLTGPERLSDKFGANDIRSRLPWRQEPRRSGILSLYKDVWAPMAEKYGCSYANLFEAWALSQFEGMSLLTGFRRVRSILDTAKCVGIRLSKDDIASLSGSARPVQAEDLDK